MMASRVVVAVGVYLSAAGVGAAGQYVDWLDDGTVLLKLGPEYDNAVLETSRAELGSRFGPDKKPFDGVTITVLTQDEGAKGAISGPIEALRPVWEELTGGKVQLALVPVTELYASTMLDLQQGTGRYDVMMVAAFYYGDLIAGKYIAPVDSFMASGEYPQWSYDSMPASLRTLYHWSDVGYGVLNDADGQILYYRRDILNDPKWQAAFQQATGHAMAVPPKTWQQLLEISKFFAGKNWDTHDSQPDEGTVLHLKIGEQGHYHFQSLSASFAITPGDRVDRFHNVYWFDPTDMKPLINSPGHVAALEFLQALNETGPVEQIGWRLPQAWEYFLRGKAVFMYTWGDLGALCQDETRSNVKGNCAATVLPSSDRYWDMEKGIWVETTKPRFVGNTTGGSWHGVISAVSKHKEAAYSFLALMATKPVSLWNGQHGWTGVDPGFYYQFLKPEGEAKLADYIKAGWNKADVTDYLNAFYRNYTAPTMLTYLRIRGTQEYWSELDSEVGAALGGRKSARQALDDTAAAWEAITDRLGRDQQLRAYQAAIGYQGNAKEPSG
jgi:multiple sugar transport system substrate-binding protein